MLIGAMNHPAADVLGEIAWMADLGLDFVDLTLEPPAAASWRVDPDAIRAALDHTGLGVVGHTAYYLPFASPFEEVRLASIIELRRCVDVFAQAGARWMNLHPDRVIPMHDRSFAIERNLQTLREVLPYAQERGIGLMIENLPGEFNSPEQVGELLEALPDLGFHLDLGHANLLAPADMGTRLIQAYGSRIRHVHVHDNRGGGADLHLPLGAGSVDVAHGLGALRAAGYDGTITLEVFSPDRGLLAYSRDRLRELWAQAAPDG